MTKKYKVTCLKCKESDVLTILDERYVTAQERELQTNILAARLRPDGTWGFECRCGNDNRLAAKEAGRIDELVIHATGGQMDKIKSQLLTPDNKQFTMEAV